MSMKKRAAVLCAAGALLGGVLVTTSAESANAASPAGTSSVCSAPAVSNNSDADMYYNVSVTLHSGPATECPGIVKVAAGVEFFAWCGTTNAYGNYWVYGRLSGSNILGWTYLGDLNTYSGSVHNC